MSSGTIEHVPADNSFYFWQNESAEADEDEDLDSTIESVPLHELRNPVMDTYHTSAFDLDVVSARTCHSHPAEGVWTGYCFVNSGEEISTAHGAFQLSIGPVASDGSFEGKCMNYWDVLEIKGSIAVSEISGPRPRLAFTLSYPDGYRLRFIGSLDVDSESIKGEWTDQIEETGILSDPEGDVGGTPALSVTDQVDVEDGMGEENDTEDLHGAESECLTTKEELSEEQAAVSLSSPPQQFFTFTRTPAALQRFKSKVVALGKATARARCRLL